MPAYYLCDKNKVSIMGRIKEYYGFFKSNERRKKKNYALRNTEKERNHFLPIKEPK